MGYVILLGTEHELMKRELWSMLDVSCMFIAL
jgi:hypothetical protein